MGSFPYPSTRQPVVADEVVATSQPTAAAAALEMFAAGGDAVDAAVAAAVALAVTEPVLNGIGGDLFALVGEPDGSCWALDASGRSPAALDPTPLLGNPAMPLRGWDTVTVPGAVSGWALLAERGTLGLDRVMAPAIRLAEDGFLVAPITAAAWAKAPEAYADASFVAAFLPGGRAPSAGDRFRLDGAAETLRRIASDGDAAFYRGALAAAVERFARSGGGALRADDLAAHRSEWVRPVEAAFADWGLVELPPATQGLAALLGTAIVDRIGLAGADPDGPGAVHVQVEATKLALAVTREVVADRDRMQVSVDDLLATEFVDGLAERIEDDRARDPGHGRPAPGGTVYVATGDRHGRVVSLIQSNFVGFGSGLVVPGTGISLQNRGAGFSTDPRSPNVVAPGVRPFHTIIPGMVRTPTGERMAMGMVGGPLQPQGHLQMLVRAALSGLDPQAIIDTPRWRVDDGLDLAVEPGWDPSTLDDLARRGHHVRVETGRSGFGGAQAVLSLPSGGWMAASDGRKDGHAAGR